MRLQRTPVHQKLRRALLIVALVVGSSTAIAGMPSSRIPSLGTGESGSASAHGLTLVLPFDRGIMLLEGRQRENPATTYRSSQPTATGEQPAAVDAETPINYCIPCEVLT